MKKKVVSILLVVSLTTSLMMGCGTKNTSESVANEVTKEQTAGQTEMTEEEALEAAKDIYLNPEEDIEARIQALLSVMTLEEKTAQMVQPERANITLDEITQYGVGSVLSGGGSAPTTGNLAENWREYVNSVKQASLESRLGIPVIYGVDAVHGHNNVTGSTIFPHNIGLGATRNPELVEKIGQMVAKEVRATGVQYTFAPTLGNPQNERWGRTYECFGEEVDLIAELGSAYIKGFQGELGTEDYLTEEHVIACAKHYLGEGYTVDGVNQGDIQMDEAEFETLLRDTLLVPYKAAIDAGVRTVMASYNSVNGLKCHENGYIIQDILKDELGFTGFVISDYNGVQQVQGVTYKDQVKASLMAGIDMFMEVSVWKDTMNALQKLVEDGEVDIARIDDAVTRILRVKFEAGLFEEEVSSATQDALFEEFGGEEHREVARQAVRESLVLLKNDMVGDKTAIESLAGVTNVLVAGPKAVDIGVQCGGWTISWEGRSTFGKQLNGGTPIIQAIANELGEGATVNFTADGVVDITPEMEAVVVVIGEMPYVESGGDRTETSLTISTSDGEMLENLREAMKASGRDIPVVAVMLAGRPLPITDYLDDFDAFVMAFLPGTEAAGISDVLFGDYDFSGVLTYTWPKTAADIQNKFDEGNEDAILFPIYSGLRKDGSAIVQ